MRAAKTNPAINKNIKPESIGTHSGSQHGGVVPVVPPPPGGGPPGGCANKAKLHEKNAIRRLNFNTPNFILLIILIRLKHYFFRDNFVSSS